MLKIENTEAHGWEAAIRGMRNPMNSWEKGDSESCCGSGNCQNCLYYDACPSCYMPFVIGPNDLDLMKRLVPGGPVHAKFRRMITVYLDITAPLYWWKEFDTYKVGTVANSCSTMHKIQAKEFILDDFSCEHLFEDHCFYTDSKTPGIFGATQQFNTSAIGVLKIVIETLNLYREKYLETKDKTYWWQMIQLLPSSYNQRRTVMLNYEVLANIYKSRRNHKLDEWHTFCDWIESLPYSDLITTPIQQDTYICKKEC